MKMFFSISIKNFWNKKNIYDNLFYLCKKITKNKFFEFEIIQHSENLFCFELDIIFTERDHAGPSMCIGLFGFEWWGRIYDHRHWDYSNNCWQDSQKTI